MRRGIVVHNDENVGIFYTLPGNKIMITLENERHFDNFMVLSEDGGTVLALLSMPEEIEGTLYSKIDNERPLSEYEGFKQPNNGASNYNIG